jgi:uncharacterized protein
LNTVINGVNVKITEKTDYPFSDKIEFVISPEKETEFTIYLRNPEWSANTHIEGAESKDTNGFLILSKKWKKGDRISLSFNSEIKMHTAFDQSRYLQKGSLVYALNIPSRAEIIRKYDVPGFYDYHHYPTDSTYKNVNFMPGSDPKNFSAEDINGSTDNPWARPVVALKGKMMKGQDQIDVELIPMGCTLLRKVTFK